MTLNHQEAILTAGNIKEQQHRRELYEALVTECDFPELLAETVAVLCDKSTLNSVLGYARRGSSAFVLYTFNSWLELAYMTGIERTFWFELWCEVPGLNQTANRKVS